MIANASYKHIFEYSYRFDDAEIAEISSMHNIDAQKTLMRITNRILFVHRCSYVFAL